MKRALIEIQTKAELGTSAMARWAAHLADDAQYERFSGSQWQKTHTDHGGTAGDLADRRAKFIDQAIAVAEGRSPSPKIPED